MKEYSPAGADIHRRMVDLIRQHHSELGRSTIRVVMVESPELDIEPIAVKVLSPLARASGAADAILLVDAFAFSDASEGRKVALLDHALASLQIVAKDGVPASDASNRPRLRRRRPQMLAQGFPDVLARHGRDSLEHEQGLAVGALMASHGTLGDRVRSRGRFKVPNVSAATTN